MPLLRSLRAYAAPLALLAATGAVTATVVVLAAALAGAGPSEAHRATVAPLLVLGPASVAALGTLLARRRLPELRLARLRGAPAGRLVLLAAAGPALVVLVGAAVGTVAAQPVLAARAARWDVPSRLGATEVAVGAAVGLLLALVVAAVAAIDLLPGGAVAAGGAAPPADEPVRVPGRTLTAAASVALVVAAGAVAYTGEHADRPSWAVLLGSAVLGLAAGQAAVLVLRGLGRAAGAATAVGRPVALLVGGRRLGTPRYAALVRTTVAAAVVAGLAWSGASAQDAWAERSAGLSAGAPVSIALPGTGALEALALTERVDPDGRWLMAAAVDDERTEAGLRTAYLDLARFDRVTTGIAGTLPTADLLRGAAVQPVEGTRLSGSAEVDRPTTVSLDYVGDSGSVRSVDLLLVPARRGEPVSGSTAIPDCVEACVPVRLEASRPVRVDTLAIGPHDLLTAPWVSERAAAATAERPRRGLRLRRERTYVPAARMTAQPVLVAGGPDLTGGSAGAGSGPGSATPSVVGIDGEPRPVDVLAQRDALPLLVGAGVVGDLRLALAGSLPSVPSVRVLVLARADTPDDVLAAVAAAGGDPPARTAEDTGAALGSARADRTVRGLLALGSGLLAVLVLLGAAGSLVREGRRDLPGLRVAGVPARVARVAVAVEAAGVAVATAAAGLAGVLVGLPTLVDVAGLVPSGPTSLAPPSPALAAAALALGVLAAGWLVLVVLARLRAGLPAGVAARGSARDRAVTGVPVTGGGPAPSAGVPSAGVPSAGVPGAGVPIPSGAGPGRPRGGRGRWTTRRPGASGARLVLGTLLRGLRSRAVLSLGSVLLVALAVGATVVGPAFQEASVRSYTVTRVAGAADLETAVSWRVDQGRSDLPLPDLVDAALDRVAALVPDGYRAPDVSLWGGPFTDLRDPSRPVSFVARADVCATLAVQGRCPQADDEVLVSSETVGALGLGDTLELPELGRLTVVGTYDPPATSDDWLLPTLLVSVPPGPTRPPRPAPYVVTPEAVASLPAASRYALLDSRLDVASDLGPDQLATLVAGVDALDSLAPAERRIGEGGRLEPDTQLTTLDAVLDDARAEADAARSAVSPAVLSLVLVALAMLLRLLGAMAELRVPELTLASLRGAGRRREWSLGLAEPALLLLVGVPLGLGAGWLVATGLVRAWLLPGTPVAVPGSSYVGAALVVAALAATAVVAVQAALRESVGDRLSGIRRPREAGRLALVVEVLLLALAVALPVLRIGADTGRGLDLGALLLPVVEAVGAGLVVTRLATALARAASRRTTGGPLSVVIAVRALARRAEGTLVMLPVTAAVAVSVFAIGVSGAAADWRASVAATRSPAAEVWLSPLTPDETLALTRTLDPDGRSLLAAAEVTLTSGRAVLVDADRLGAVATWSDSWLDGRGASDVAGLLAPPSRPVTLAGDRVSLTLTNDTTEAATAPVRAQLGYVSSSAGVQRVLLGPFGPGTTTARARLTGCETACDLTELTVGGTIAQPETLHGRLTVGELRADDSGPASLAEWVSSSPAGVLQGDGVLSVDTGAGPAPVGLVSPAVGAPLRAVAGRLATGLLDEGPSGPELTLPSGTVRVSVTAGAESTPLLGPRGVLFDLQTFTAAVPVTPELAQASVLVADGVPAELRDRLAAAGLSAHGGYDATRAELDASAYAQAMRLYRAVGAALLLAALGGLVVSFAVQLPGRRRDAAALRVVGVRPRTVALATAWEALVTLGLSALAGLGAGVVAQQLLLGSLTLGIADDGATPRVLPELDLARLAAFAAAVVGGLLVLTIAGSLVVVRRARAASLRETAR